MSQTKVGNAVTLKALWTPENPPKALFLKPGSFSFGEVSNKDLFRKCSPKN